MITIVGYSDLERIGHGGLGDVYRATRESTGGAVAIKVLRDVSDESVAWHRTRRELTALVALAGHAHVIQLVELLDLAEGPALVMEYAPGGSVADLLARRGATLTVPEVVLIGRHTADALVAAHDQDIVHRDLKPQNLLIDAYGRIKLCDFGIASLARSDDFQTRTNALSLRYASPEDLDEEAEVGPASDVYSLGATLVHLVHGTPLAVKDRLQPWAAPPTDDVELAAVDEVIEQCLQTDPERRPTSAEVLDQLEAIDWTLAVRCRSLPVEAPPRAPEGPDDDDDTESRADAPAPDEAASAVLAGAAAGSAIDERPPPEVVRSAAPADLAPVDLENDTSSTTARRSDAVARPAPVRPPAEPTRRRWPWVAGALVVAAVIGVGAAILWPADDDTADPSDESDAPPDSTSNTPETTPAADGSEVIEIVPRPDGLPQIDDDSIIWPFGSAGECLVQVNGLDELMPIDCGEPHDLQRFAVDNLDPVDFPSGAAYSPEAVRVTTDDECREAFTAFVGVDPADSTFEIAVTRPSQASWTEDDRRFQCLLGVPDHHIVGDAEASAT